jgi:hypothetical protein
VHVIDLAVRSTSIVIRSTVPTRNSGLYEDRLGVCRDVNLLVFSRNFSGSLGDRRIRGRLFRGDRWWWRNLRLLDLMSTTAEQSSA